MKRYIISISLLIVFAATIMVMGSSKSIETQKNMHENAINVHELLRDDNACDDPDYIYWPEYIDSTKFRVNRVKDYFGRIDTLNKEIDTLRTYINIYDEKMYYQMHIKYKEMEILSKDRHPIRERYYRSMQKLYLRAANDLKSFKYFESQINKKYRIAK